MHRGQVVHNPEMQLPISVGAYESVVHDIGFDPSNFDGQWGELSRSDPALALSLLSTARYVEEAGLSASDAFVSSAVILLNSLNREKQASVEEQLLVDEAFPESAPIIKLSKFRELKRALAAITIFASFVRT